MRSSDVMIKKEENKKNQSRKTMGYFRFPHRIFLYFFLISNMRFYNIHQSLDTGQFACIGKFPAPVLFPGSSYLPDHRLFVWKISCTVCKISRAKQMLYDILSIVP